jgi:hypothetical protein
MEATQRSFTSGHQWKYFGRAARHMRSYFGRDALRMRSYYGRAADAVLIF